MSVVGTWNSFYTWSCGKYNQGTITFNNDGTFRDSGGYTGTWSQREGTVLLIYSASPTAFAGNVVHGSITGMGIQGTLRWTCCWYATSQTIGRTSDAEDKEGLSMSGAELSESAT